MRVREAVPAEYEAVGRLTVEAYETGGHLRLADGRRDTDYAAFLADAGTRADRGRLMVAVDDTEVLLGTVTWCPPGSTLRELGDGDTHGEIRTLAVAPTAQGGGVGAAMLQWCLDQARTASLARVMLSSMPSQRVAHRLYAQRGFVRRPERDWHPVPGVTLWVFVLDLAEEAA